MYLLGIVFGLFVVALFAITSAISIAHSVVNTNKRLDENHKEQVWLVHLYPTTNKLHKTDITGSTRAEQREITYHECQKHISASQTFVSDIITNQALPNTVSITRLWILNVLIVRTIQKNSQVLSFMEKLKWLPSVIDVEMDTSHRFLMPSHDATSLVSIDDNKPQSNIKWLHADELWAQNITGQGITIASIDSGVRYTHEALYESFRGYQDTTDKRHFTFDYSFWFPPGTNTSQETPDTADLIGHGTHTVGTAIGKLGIGVAPKAQWIAARAFDIHGAAKKSDFLLATQWILCPTKTDGSGRNCSLGADVVMGSFGVDRSDHETFKQWTWLTDILQIWERAGTRAVFAAGNTNGFKCGTVYYPASRHESIAVGALMGGTTLWGASGKGPSIEIEFPQRRIIKPDFVAPGGAIRSALSTADTKYTRMTGTSMAAPHVVGALALLLSAENHSSQNHSHTDWIRILRDSASHNLHKPFLVPSKCDQTSYNEYPNNIYGSGLPNVCRAVATVMDKIKCTTQEELVEMVAIE